MFDFDKRQYRPKGYCIYCRRTKDEVQLTKEHLIPFSLGGTAVLPRSSCIDCAKITRDFETTCARAIFGNFRIMGNYPTRRPWERPTSLPIERVVGGQTEHRQVSIADYPIVAIPMVTWGYPGINIGLPKSAALHGAKVVVVLPHLRDGTDRLERLGVFSGASVSIQTRFEPIAFARMLAKIAHAILVAEYGIESFRPLVTELIRGLDADAPYWVGGCEPPGSYPGKEHIIEFGLNRKAGRQTYACARIHLFHFLPNFPAYEVVVGEPTPELERLLTEPSPPEARLRRDGKTVSHLR